MTRSKRPASTPRPCPSPRPPSRPRRPRGTGPSWAARSTFSGGSRYFTSDWRGAGAHLRQAALAADASGDDPLRVHVLGALAHLEAQQAHDAAVPPLRDAAFAALARLGKDDADEADLLQLLSVADNAQGKHEDARAKIQRVIELKTALYGERSWQVGVALGNMANTYPGWEPESLEYDLRALDIEESLLGPESPLIADIEMGIGNALVEQERPVEAEAHLRRSLAMLEEGSGAEHPETPLCLLNLEEALAEEGKYDEALAFASRALELDERRLPPDHPRLFEPLVGVGDSTLGLGQPAKAVPLIERALALPREDTETRRSPRPRCSWPRASTRCTRGAAAPSRLPRSPRPRSRRWPRARGTRGGWRRPGRGSRSTRSVERGRPGTR